MMWELIRLNKRKSYVLFVGMAVMLVLLGYFIGGVFDPDVGGIVGIAIAVGLWLLLTVVSLTSGDEILLKVTGAREITKDVNPRLFNVVEEMKIAAGLPAMPKVYIVDQAAPNAFAIGTKPEKSAVAVTAGLLERLNRDELQGVVAHEMAHIANRDSQLMTVAGIMLGSIILLSQVFLRSWWFIPSGSRRYRKSSGGSPQLQLVMILLAVALAILAPIFARLLYLAISRKREYLADATAVQLTRYPEGLASALEKISQPNIAFETANSVTAPMFIIPPFVKKEMKLSSLGSTHPPTRERIRILRAMSAGADLKTYEAAYERISKGSGLIPASSLAKAEKVAIREPHHEPEPPKSTKKTARDVMDLMRAVNDYAFISCACGLRMKLPPELPADATVSCPRCGRGNKVPIAEIAPVAAVVGAAVASGKENEPESKSAAGGPQTLEYHRKGTGWETFACACGRLMQLSPAFEGDSVECRSCGRRTLIK